MRHQVCLFSFCVAFITPAFSATPTGGVSAPTLYKVASAKPQSTPSLSNGFYIGLAAGYDAYRTRPNINLSFHGETMTGSPALSSTGFVGGIFGGYGEYYKNL